MFQMKIGVQVYSVREDAARDFKGTISRLKDMGYDGVELAGLYGLSAEEIRSALDEVGIAAISAHVPYQELAVDTEKTIRDYQKIGCEYIAIPWLEEKMRPGTDLYPDFVASISGIAACCKKYGITLLYHNHDFEFVKLSNGLYALDDLYETIPACELQTELDTCWVHVGGEDPAGYIKKYAGRCPLVHLKDYVGSKTANMYELIGTDEARSEVSEQFAFRPVGYGVLDIPSIVEASEASGASWVIVEQDRSDERPMMEEVQLSIEYLKTL